MNILKKPMIYLIPLFLSSLMISSLSSTYARDPCTRHIYNDSSKPWYFKNTTMKGELIIPNCEKHEGFCKIHPQPGHSGPGVPIIYKYSDSIIQGMVTIKDSCHQIKTFNWDNTIVGLKPCPYIQHSGGTGSVSVNEPADGDFTIHKHHDCW